MKRDHWQRRIDALDPEVDFVEIYRIMAGHEFPWDMTQSLGLALYRTYAVPSIGELLAATGEFATRTHKRYADTGLILDAVLEHGFASVTGRSAIRRMNQMHGAYEISNDDMRYVLSTFVVIPMRWMDRFGWPPMTEGERVASANYYRELGRHMNTKDRPRSHQEFAAHLDAYEREQFAYSPGGRAVADATLALLAGFYPRPLRPLLRRGTLALLDPPLRDASRYPDPGPVTRALTVARASRAPWSSATCRRAAGHATFASCASSRSTGAATRWTSSARFPPKRPASDVPGKRPDRRRTSRPLPRTAVRRDSRPRRSDATPRALPKPFPPEATEVPVIDDMGTWARRVDATAPLHG